MYFTTQYNFKSLVLKWGTSTMGSKGKLGLSDWSF